MSTELRQRKNKGASAGTSTAGTSAVTGVIETKGADLIEISKKMSRATRDAQNAKQASSVDPTEPARLVGAPMFLSSLPKSVFERSTAKAMYTLSKSLVVLVLSYVMLSHSPWYALPFGWMLAAVASTGLYTIAADCAAERFVSSHIVNLIVGTICFMPLLYPLEAWRFNHQDVTRTPGKPRRAVVESKPKSMLRLVLPFFWIWDVLLGLSRYFDLSQFPNSVVTRARNSVWLVYLFGFLFFPIMFKFTGAWGIVKYWLLPWILLHFWKNTFRAFRPVSYDAKENKYSFTYYRLPGWVERLCHDFNFQVPNYLSVDIPCYNLRDAYAAFMKSDWCKTHMDTFSFGAGLANAIDRASGSAGSTANAATATKRGDASGGSSAKASEQKPSAFVRLFTYLRFRINWLHAPLLLGIPAIGIYGAFTTPLQSATLKWALFMYVFSGLGVTAGYHRLWSHRSYDASWIVRFFLMLGGSSAIEGSIRWWSRDHRAHHRYTDTPKDPYAITEGFWWAHMGWMLHKQDPAKIGRADISDLNADPMVRFQHRCKCACTPLLFTPLARS